MYKYRLRVILILVFGGFLMVSTRLFYLQVVQGAHYRDYAANVRVRRELTEACRGRILAAGGELLAFDAPAWHVALVPTRLPEWRELWDPVYKLYKLRRRERILSVRDLSVEVADVAGGRGYVVDFAVTVLFLRRRGTSLVESQEHGEARIAVPEATADLVDRLSVISGAPSKEMLKAYFEGLALAARRWRRQSDPVVVARDVGFRAAAEIESCQDWYPGARILIAAKRSYPHEGLAAHVLGYTQAVSAAEYERWKDDYKGNEAKRFLPDDTIGRRGVERAFDVELRPARGEQLLEVDAARNTQQVLHETPAVPGADLHLTIDVDVQRATEQALRAFTGSAIVMEPATGRILAMASAPAFDANDLREHPPDPADRLTPMLDRAVQGEYQLGSAFKLLLALGALEEGKAFREITCRGSYHGHGCRNHRTPMVITLHDAIKRSCNVYFYRTGQEMLGVRGIAKWGTRLGLGQRSGVALPGERPGLLPTQAWKQQRYGEAWYPGDTRNLSIGQGYLLVTPLQVARFLCAIANGGKLVPPRLVDRVVVPGGPVRDLADESEVVDLGLSAATTSQLHRAMRGVCHEMGGTARRAWSGWIEEQGYAVAGKTSTADARLRGADANIGWFVCFAPVGDPRVVIVVALEHTGDQAHFHGADVAAPVTRSILERLPERYLEGIPGGDLRAQHRAGLATRPADTGGPQ